MASAILLFYTSEGFLIAADGRARTDGTVLSDTMIKIFPISEPNKSLAYAFGGSIAITDKDDPKIILFDFRVEILKAIESLRVNTCDDLASYAKELSTQLFLALANAQKNDRVEPFKENSPLIACLFLAGYFNKQPSWISIQFTHQSQVLVAPAINQMALIKSYKPSVVYGSKVVAEHLFDMDDPEFAKYRVPRINSSDHVTVSEVSNVARNYILACSDPAAMKLDAGVCAAIGGDIHIAKVTPQGGFKWVIPPATTS
jgi:hypothetical protein